MQTMANHIAERSEQVWIDELDKSTNIILAIMTGSSSICPKSSQLIKFYYSYVITHIQHALNNPIFKFLYGDYF